jgi:hypothetical protein
MKSMADENNKTNNVPLDENEEIVDERPGSSPVDDDENLDGRLERLGGEPAPVITPEEFARLQKAGQVHIDARGRVRTASRSGPNAGVSLRKRRAWYAL